MTGSSDDEQTFRIGTVAKLTGISPETLRVWERRYAVVTPSRSAAGGREYSQKDIERLRLIKRLIDSGDAIGSVAGLDSATLQTRAAQQQDVAKVDCRESDEPRRLVVIGDTLAYPFQMQAEAWADVELVASGINFDVVRDQIPGSGIDILVVEIPTLHVDTTGKIIEWLEAANARQALVIYRFAAAAALRRLPTMRVQTFKGAVSPVTVRRLCIAMFPSRGVSTAAGSLEAGLSMDIAPRRFSNADLSKLASVSSAVKCECPKHLAELIADLVAFERYSAECENRNLPDAALHAYLHSTASRARSLIEEALVKVIEAEGILLEEP